MGYRFSCKAAAVALAGTTFNHLLYAVPDEWSVNLRGPTPGAATLYVTTVNSTSIIVCASGAAGTGDIFCNVNHSFTN